LYTFVTIIAIVIGIAVKHELFTERLNVVQNFNNSQSPTAEASGFDGVPKYPMAVHAEKA